MLLASVYSLNSYIAIQSIDLVGHPMLRASVHLVVGFLNNKRETAKRSGDICDICAAASIAAAGPSCPSFHDRP